MAEIPDDFFEEMCRSANRKALDAEWLSDSDQEELIQSLDQFQRYSALHASSRKPGHHVEIGFFESVNFDAFATTWREVDGIGISWGVMIRLKETFDALVAMPSYFDCYNDDQKKYIATWLRECAKWFIFFHELGHIWNGHTSFLNEHGRAEFYFETSSSGGEALSNIDRQTLEFDADCFAAANIFNFGFLQNPFKLAYEKIESQAGEGSTKTAMISFSLYVLFRMFDKELDFDEHARRQYPSPPLRNFLIFSTMIAQAEKKGTHKNEEIKAQLINGMVFAEVLYSKLKNQDHKIDVLNELMGPKTDIYLNKILRNWHNLYPRLNVLKRGGVLPPPQDLGEQEDFGK